MVIEHYCNSEHRGSINVIRQTIKLLIVNPPFNIRFTSKFNHKQAKFKIIIKVV